MRRPGRRALGTSAVAWWAVVAAAAAIAACSGTSATPEPAPAVATVPPGWVTVSTSTRGLQLTLPPWLIPFDNVNVIFANEPPPPGGPIAVQLRASGPSIDGPRAGEDVARWFDATLADAGAGAPMVTRVALPAGPAVRYERIDRAGTIQEWHFLAYGISTPSGFAYVIIDGSPGGWRRRAADFEWIARLLRVP
jgi:hypothetical protein